MSDSFFFNCQRIPLESKTFVFSFVCTSYFPYWGFYFKFFIIKSGGRKGETTSYTKYAETRRLSSKTRRVPFSAPSLSFSVSVSFLSSLFFFYRVSDSGLAAVPLKGPSLGPGLSGGLRATACCAPEATGENPPGPRPPRPQGPFPQFSAGLPLLPRPLAPRP